MTHALVAPRLVWRMLRAFMLTIIHLLSALFFLERGPNGSEATWQDNKDTNVFPRADAWNMIWACRLCSSQNIFPSTLPDQKQGRQIKKQQQLQNKTFPLDFFFPFEENAFTVSATLTCPCCGEKANTHSCGQDLIHFQKHIWWTANHAGADL